jgi:Bifunctional DNA primase/polymerase, N-terminal/Primase C terminal 1 (PriCT-1)
MTGVFAEWQSRYAAHGVPTFPVHVGRDGKRPMVSHYGKFGLSASARIAQRFPDAAGIGFMAGPHSRITVMDVDSSDERQVTAAMTRHGQTPVIVRSGSGHYHCYFRWNGERRLVRPFENTPIDVLGDGVVVAPPSRGAKTDYRFVHGNLDDLGRLPVMRGIRSDTERNAVEPSTVREGARNSTLFAHCMRAARSCDDYDALLDVARTRNDEFSPPLADTEVVKTARSAWGYEQRGENRFGRLGVSFEAGEATKLICMCPDAFLLLAFLRANNRPGRTFMIANGLADTLGWRRQRLTSARKQLQDWGYIRLVCQARQHEPALYQWGCSGCPKLDTYPQQTPPSPVCSPFEGR